jgi:hypothetical protein
MRTTATALKTFILLSLLAMVGCVGTVEKADPPKTDYFEPKTYAFDFPGIVNARAVSHHRIEVEFYPTFGINDTYRYWLFVNGDVDPILLNLESMFEAPGGRLMYVIKGLAINTTYKLKIRAQHVKDDAWSKGEEIVYVTTFDNKVSTFEGTVEITKVLGSTDTTVRIDWVAPDMEGLFIPAPFDPVYYEITYISSQGGPSNLNNDNYAGSDRFVVRVPEPPTLASPSNNPSTKVISNLTPGETYYFQVRAVNKLFNDYDIDPNVNVIPVDHERNQRYLKVKMDEPNGLYDFQKDSLVLINAPGDKAFERVDVFWEPGDGAYYGYRLFVREYDGIDDPELDDLLDIPMLDAMALASDYENIASDQVNFQKVNLNPYTDYQFKIVLCKTITCPLDPADPDAGLISEMRYIRTKPTLAPFSGITFLYDPTDALELDKIKATFDPPVLSQGHATDMEFFCVNPDDYTSYVEFPASPAEITGSGVANCDGLSLPSTIELDDQQTFIKGVRNVNTDGFNLSRYCFAAAPKIEGTGLETIKLDPSGWVVRCINPEVQVPTVDQYSGAKGDCAISQNTVNVVWDLPDGGIYNGFRVWWKERIGPNKFSFNDASGGSLAYTNSGDLPNTQTSYTIPDLRPGKTYEVGVLAVADDGAIRLYSEANLNIQSCVIPRPEAYWEEWTRIMAVGPKINGMYPKEDIYNYPDEAHINEFVNQRGVPEEVMWDFVNDVADPAQFKIAPGSYQIGFEPVAWNDNQHDAAPNADGNYYSKTGVVSLAWKEIAIEFLDAEFKSMQDKNPVRSARKYGYKVLRSDDNQMTWKELTAQSGYLHATDHTWYPYQGSATPLTEKWVFFHDYSARYAKSNSEIDKARVLYYKIVPYFDDLQLDFADADVVPPNILKVVMPPANMAYVSRMMVNRAQCYEMGFEINKGPGIPYTCDYNGVGATQKSTPWQLGQTQIDLGHDMLIDRFEVGCKVTRGSIAKPKESGLSFFDKPDADYDGTYHSKTRDFIGYTTDATGADQPFPFRGCVGEIEGQFGNYGADNPDYRRVVHGDCVGGGYLGFRAQTCNPPNNSGYIARFGQPGAHNPDEYADDMLAGVLGCEAAKNNDPLKPQTATSAGPNHPNRLLDKNFSRSVYAQGELFAVFYNRTTNYAPAFPHYAPQAFYREISTNILNGSGYDTSCSLNFAAIDTNDGGNWRSRWAPVNLLQHLNYNGAKANVMDLTVSEVLSNNSHYNTDTYVAPNKLPFWNTQRFDENTKMARIFADNSAKLPPLKSFVHDHAVDYCKALDVQIGLYDEDNDTWVSSTQPYQKGLIRRRELIGAGMWSDNMSGADIQAVEARNTDESIGACIGSGSLPGDGTFLNVNSRIPANFPKRGGGSSPALTGSSKNDYQLQADDNSSHICTSRFGVQDLVGNMWEMNTDKIFCDYSLDKLYYGKYTGDPVTDSGFGFPDLSVELSAKPNLLWSYISSSDQTWHILANIDIEIANDPIAGNLSGNTTYANIDVNSGYCSVVDIDETRSDDETIFREITGVFKSIYNLDGSVNPDVVQVTNQLDIESVNFLRNGDAFFLNWGPTTLGPQLSDNNTWGLDGSFPNPESSIGPYFNPILGVPLQCKGVSCGPSASDNKRITTPFFETRDTPNGTTIADYSSGNSQITTIGISDFLHRNGAETYTMDINANVLIDAGVDSNRIITRITLNGDGDDPTSWNYNWCTRQQIYNGTCETVNGALLPTGDQVLDLTFLDWVLERDEPMALPSGGGYDYNRNGRFTFKNVTSPFSETGDMRRREVGIRCAVRLKQ